MQFFKRFPFEVYFIHAILLVQFILAWHFAEHRFICDTSYYFFKALNSANFHIEHQRYVLALAELPVVLMSKYHFPLQWILYVFSVWHIIYYYIIGYLCFKISGKHGYWLLVVLMQVIGVHFGFYGPIFEQFYGTALAVLFFVLLQKYDNTSIGSHLILMIVFILVITSHPFNFLLALYLMFLDYLKTKYIRKYLILLVSIPCFIAFKILFMSEYEAGKIVWTFNLSQNKTYETIYEWKHVVSAFKFLLTYYLETFISLIVTIIYLLRTKHYFNASIVFSTYIATWALIRFTCYMESYTRYFEQVHYLIVPVAFITFVYFVSDVKKSNTVKYSLVFAIVISCTFRFIKVFEIGRRNTQKTLAIKSLVDRAQQQTGTKLFVRTENCGDACNHFEWDTPYLTLLYSALHKFPKQVSIYHLEEDFESFRKISNDKYWFRLEEQEPIDKLNPNYFKLKNEAYRELR